MACIKYTLKFHDANQFPSVLETWPDIGIKRRFMHQSLTVTGINGT